MCHFDVLIKTGYIHEVQKLNGCNMAGMCRQIFQGKGVSAFWLKRSERLCQSDCVAPESLFGCNLIFDNCSQAHVADGLVRKVYNNAVISARLNFCLEFPFNQVLTNSVLGLNIASFSAFRFV